MPQLSLCITEANLEALRTRAQEEGVSLSEYVNRLIEQDAENSGWPKGFWELYGALGEDGLAIPDDMPPTDDAEFEQLFA